MCRSSSRETLGLFSTKQPSAAPVVRSLFTFRCDGDCGVVLSDLRLAVFSWDDTDDVGLDVLGTSSSKLIPKMDYTEHNHGNPQL